MEKSIIAAIDQGTTSTRCLLFEQNGNVVSSGQKEHKQFFPQAGWVEHDPAEIWANTLHVIQEARDNGQVSLDSIAAVGITNQRETTVVWNKRTGKAYHPAIVWQDIRTEPLVKHFRSIRNDAWWREKTGLPVSTYFSALKLRWLLEKYPEIRTDAEQGLALFGTIDTYLSWNLTGGANGGMHVTDVTNASRTQMMNLASLSWDEEILELLDIPSSMLPHILPSSMNYGAVNVAPLRGVRLCGILGDQQAALFGQNCFQPGEAKNTYGTGCFLLLNTGNKIIQSKHGLLTTLAYQLEGEEPVYALEGSVAIAGALVQWLRDNLGIIRDGSEVEALARTVEDNGGAYFVPAFSGLFAPHWNAGARGTLTGLTSYINRAHIARAVLEATAFQTWDVLEAMEKDADLQLKALKVDGGMVMNELLMQFQSDILEVPVIRPKMIETTALGAAYAAGLSIGLWNSREDLVSNWQADREWIPAMDRTQRTSLLDNWKKAVERSLDWE